jgi:hypothetical protein
MEDIFISVIDEPGTVDWLEMPMCGVTNADRFNPYDVVLKNEQVPQTGRNIKRQIWMPVCAPNVQKNRPVIPKDPLNLRE